MDVGMVQKYLSTLVEQPMTDACPHLSILGGSVSKEGSSKVSFSLDSN